MLRQVGLVGDGNIPTEDIIVQCQLSQQAHPRGSSTATAVCHTACAQGESSAAMMYRIIKVRCLCT